MKKLLYIVTLCLSSISLANTHTGGGGWDNEMLAEMANTLQFGLQKDGDILVPIINVNPQTFKSMTTTIERMGNVRLNIKGKSVDMDSLDFENSKIIMTNTESGASAILNEVQPPKKPTPTTTNKALDILEITLQ